MTQLTASTYQARSRRAAHSFASCIRTLADQLVTVFFWGPQGVSWWQLRIVPSCQQPPNISKHCQYKTNTHAYLGHMLLLMLQADEGARPKPRKGIPGLWRCIQVQAGCCHVRGQADGESMGDRWESMGLMAIIRHDAWWIFMTGDDGKGACGRCVADVQPMFNVVHADSFHAGWEIPSACQRCQSECHHVKRALTDLDSTCWGFGCRKW